MTRVLAATYLKPPSLELYPVNKRFKASENKAKRFIEFQQRMKNLKYFLLNL